MFRQAAHAARFWSAPVLWRFFARTLECGSQALRLLEGPLCSAAWSMCKTFGHVPESFAGASLPHCCRNLAARCSARLRMPPGFGVRQSSGAFGTARSNAAPLKLPRQPPLWPLGPCAKLSRTCVKVWQVLPALTMFRTSLPSSLNRLVSMNARPKAPEYWRTPKPGGRPTCEAVLRHKHSICLSPRGGRIRKGAFVLLNRGAATTRK